MKRVFNKFKTNKLILLFTLSISILPCCDNKVKGDYFGNKFEVDGAVDLNNFIATNDLSQSEKFQELKLSGEIEEVCQSKGCWMMLKTEGGTKVRVTFKDYGFFVPKDAIGKKVYLTGDAAIKKLDSATLKHFADDAGKSISEMSAVELSIVSDGVLIL